jgi:hypothetical protein
LLCCLAVQHQSCRELSALVGPEVVVKNRRLFEGLLRRATDRMNRRQYESAAGYLQIAADFASGNHSGLFASPHIEQSLLRLKSALNQPARIRTSGTGASAERVLHVLTESYAVGGHTRLVTNWIRGDGGRQHSVAVTRQPSWKFSDNLKSAAERSGGRIHFLAEEDPSLLRRVWKLANLARSYDVIVLHTHPYDVVPVLALGGPTSDTRVVLLNHADHVFWVGLTAATVFANIRVSGLNLAINRRGINSNSCTILPIPLNLPAAQTPRSEAKARLGFPPESIICLSVASPYKYEPLGALDFIETVVPVISDQSKAVLLVLGPSETGAWATASSITNGRIRPMGLRADAKRFYEAADIYLDSFPISSVTSVLEAGQHSLPVVSLRAHLGDAAVLCSDSPGLDGGMDQVSKPADYTAMLARLLNDESYRSTLGTRLRKSVEKFHSGRAWQSYCDDLYRLTLSGDNRPPLTSTTDQCQSIDLLLASLHPEPNPSHAIAGAISRHMGLLPWSERIRAWHECNRRGLSVGIHHLLPETKRMRLGRASRRVQGVVSASR